VNVLLSAFSNPTAPYGLYDVVLTSGGEDPPSLGGSGFLSEQGAQTTTPQSNRGNVIIPQVQITQTASTGTITVTPGQTVYIDPTPTNQISVSVPGAPAGAEQTGVPEFEGGGVI
jgi:hypothetical protein